MANFSLPKNYIFDNSNLTGAHIARLIERFHGKEGVSLLNSSCERRKIKL